MGMRSKSGVTTIERIFVRIKWLKLRKVMKIDSQIYSAFNEW
jgi:hypothetical protein